MTRCHLLGTNGWRALLLALCLSAVASSAQAAAARRQGVECRLVKSPVKMAKQSCLCQPCHMCEFKAFSGGCTLVKAAGMSLSDGSELKPKQPQTEPQQWFLSEDEITSSRGGVARTDLKTFSSDNTVTAFVATDEFFRSVSRDVERLGDSDRVLLTAWTIDLEAPFDPRSDAIGATTSFRSLFSRAVARGASFRGLLWTNADEKQQTTQARDAMNSLPAMKNGKNAQLIFDDRVPAGSEHNQKTLVLEHSDARDQDEDRETELVAYVGGTDLSSDRWDSVAHDQSPLRRRAGIGVHFKGWVDANVRIDGSAAKDVAANFLNRWNSKPESEQDDQQSSAFANPAYSPLPAPESPVASKLGPHHVQIVRTFSPTYRKYTEFAPEGELSLLKARVKAIRDAVNYIYIEDEAFSLIPELLDELLKALPRLQRLIIVTQKAGKGDSVAKKLLFDMLAPMQKLFPNKLQLYTLKEKLELYLNSKLMIVDDVFVSVSSAKWCERSMDADSAIGANIVDNELVATPDGLLAAKFARDFRVRKFVELTGKSYDALSGTTFVEAANQLDSAAGDAKSILESLKVEEA